MTQSPLRSTSRNSIVDVGGIRVGQAENRRIRTGVTAILFDERVSASVWVMGGGPGTVETDLLSPEAMVEKVDAVTLSGGSVFGLDTAGVIREVLARQGKGFSVSEHVRVPIVPGAILFDLLNGGDKAWETPPYRALAQEAYQGATRDIVQEGDFGAGCGAVAGDIKGGIGTAAVFDSDTGYTFGAIVAANPAGSVLIPDTDCFWGWAFERGAEYGGKRPPSRAVNPVPILPKKERLSQSERPATTIGLVVTNADLNKTQLRQLAKMAHSGLARAIYPIHSPLDGDAVFAVATAGIEGPETDPILLTRFGGLFADLLTRSICRAVFRAEGFIDVPSYRRRFGPV